MFESLDDAKRKIAAASIDGARLLGAGVSKPCSQARYNNAARAALQDPAANLSPEDRRLISSFIAGGDTDNLESPLSIRVNALQRAQLENAAADAGVVLSEYIRLKLFAPVFPDHLVRALGNACKYMRAGDVASAEKVMQYICLEMGVPYGQDQ